MHSQPIEQFRTHIHVFKEYSVNEMVKQFILKDFGLFQQLLVCKLKCPNEVTDLVLSEVSEPGESSKEKRSALNSMYQSQICDFCLLGLLLEKTEAVH